MCNARHPVIASCLLFTLVARLNAQPLQFQHITAEDGLSDNAVTCIFEDHAGYIWIGTERGLNRYDGQHVERLESGSMGPTGRHITAIAEDGRGRLWVATADAGLSMRDPAGRFIHFRHDPKDARSLPTDALNHVLVVNDSLLVLASRGKGAIWFNPNKGTIRCIGFRPETVDRNGDTLLHKEDTWCHTALQLDDGRIWLAMLHGSGSFIVDARSGNLLATLPTLGPNTNAALIDGKLYVGSWHDGLYRVDLDRPKGSTYFSLNEEITAIVRWNDGSLIAATKVGGLVRFSRDGLILDRYIHSRTKSTSILSDHTRCLLHDRAGNLWVGTAKGVSVHAPSVWRCTALALLPEEEGGDLLFHALQQDHDGTIRISTSKGFFLVDPASGSCRHVELTFGPKDLEVTGLFQVGEDAYFLGTETGIYRYDPVHERILSRESTGRWATYHAGSMFQARSIIPYRHGNKDLLLLGALGYGHRAIDRRSGTNVDPWEDYPDQRGTLMLRSTFQDPHGVCWSATEGGVVRWTPVDPGRAANGTVYHTASPEGRALPGNDVRSIAWRGDTLWVALRDAGLASIAAEKATPHLPPAHMPHDALGVALDAAGQAWLTTGNGLLRYAPRTSSWLHVPVNDGKEFKQLTPCIIALKDGRIAFCADDHLILFDPAAYDSLPPLPAPSIASITNTWNNLRMDGNGTLNLSYRESSFDLLLTALQPVGAAPLTFLPRLDGEPKSVHEVAARDPVHYTGVPAGRHHVLVRVRDVYGREGPELALFTVSVAGPFWQQWWFFALLILAGASIAYIILRYRHQQRMQVQHVRDRIARDLHDDIGSTLGSISLYSEVLRRSSSKGHDAPAQEVADRIGTTSREMIDRMGDIVWSVDPRNDNAGALIGRLQAFAKDLLSAKDIVLDFRADPQLLERKLSDEQRRNIFLICKEALHNAVKYADASHVAVVLETENRGLSITIGDDGRGFNPAQVGSYNGNGLGYMRKRATAIHADLMIDSTPQKGTCIKLVVPGRSSPRSGESTGTQRR